MTYLQSVGCLLMTLHFFKKSKRFQPISFSDLNYDLETINQCTQQWKMSFHPDSNKEATEMLFSAK